MSALPDFLPAPLAFGVELALKGTVLLLGAVLLAALLRGAAAAARHLVWTLAVVGLLALPVLSPLLPGVDVPLPRAWPVAAPALLPPAEASAAPALPAPDGAAAIPAAPARGSGWGWVPAAWAAGALALLARLALGVGRLWHLSRRAEAVRDLRWSTLAAEVSEDLGLRRPVRLLRGPRASMPITWGTLRPVVLLPAEADAWPEARRRVVLLHELAHVARGDCLTQLLAQLACALYWFHPLAWHAARRLRTERELACDDRVLGLGTPAPEYAGHLLDVARAFRAGRHADVAAIAMARPSQLEGRLLAVLDGVRDRRPPSRGARLAAGAAALALVLPLAALRPGERTDVRRRTTPAEVRGMVERISRTHRDLAVREQALEELGELDALTAEEAPLHPLSSLERLRGEDRV
ncbi:MAG TPA: M56 family metallopeptidase [Longimicrobiaceae bacterium]